MMNESHKPEWIAITESDALTAPSRSRRRMPVTAALASLSLVGAGFLFAQSATEIPAQASVVIESAQPTSDSTIATPSVAPAKVAGNQELAVPVIAPVAGQTYRGDDDDDYDDNDYGDDDDDHDEDDD